MNEQTNAALPNAAVHMSSALSRKCTCADITSYDHFTRFMLIGVLRVCKFGDCSHFDAKFIYGHVCKKTNTPSFVGTDTERYISRSDVHTSNTPNMLKWDSDRERKTVDKTYKYNKDVILDVIQFQFMAKLTAHNSVFWNAIVIFVDFVKFCHFFCKFLLQ